MMIPYDYRLSVPDIHADDPAASDKPSRNKRGRRQSTVHSNSRDEEVQFIVYPSISKMNFQLPLYKFNGDIKGGHDYLILSNRWFLWTAACLSSLIFTLSVSNAVQPIDRNGVDIAVLILSSVSVLICGVVAGSFFLRMHCVLDSVEFMAALFLVCVWIAEHLIMDGKNKLALTMNGLQVWNWNVFCSGWTAFAFVTFLFCDLVVRLLPILFSLHVYQ
jgi:hypothetical protein